MENKTNSFTDLRMWQKAHQFVLATYKISENFPKHELFGLVSQLRRAAVSIPANIAEGYKRKGKNEKLRFFNISQGSLEECRYFLILSKDLNYINTEQYQYLINQLEETSKALNSYCKVLYEDTKQNF
ncbi:MAG: four helix bundle protein [Prevotellaceae bacterium]|jgi:four helix bundle protein|nr:four helix bundle protein [Prevotellaceae bacterium]